MPDKRDYFAIAFGFIIAIGIAAAVVLTSNPDSRTPAAVLEPAEASSTYLVATTTSQAPTEATKPANSPAKPVKRVVATTTTSEVPPPLTPEQERSIPDPGEEGDIEFNEHMPNDYDLPHETVDIGLVEP